MPATSVVDQTINLHMAGGKQAGRQETGGAQHKYPEH